MANNTLTAQQRAQLFAMSTRQNQHMLAKQTAVAFPSTLTFTLPKSRLLSNLYVSVNFVGGTVAPSAIRRVSLDLNNGFAPFTCSGEDIFLYNMVDSHAHNHEAWSKKETAFNFKLPVTTNDRDPIGLILLQNDQTNVTLTIDFANIEATSASVEVMTETFSIPAVNEAMPDLSVLKLVNGRNDSLPSAGQQVIRLSTGTIYRKIIMKLTDGEGNAMTPADITSNIEVVFNQADVNYSVSPSMLRLLNEKVLGCEAPEGVYILDFSNGGGMPNYGGTRDFIDTANLTEFWVRFSTGKVGKCEIITETLARLS